MGVEQDCLPSELVDGAVTRAMMDLLSDGLIVTDDRGCMLAVNRAACVRFGYAEGELVGRNVSILMNLSDAQQHDGYLAAYRATGQGRIMGIGRVVIARSRDDEQFPVDLRLGEVTSFGKRYFLGIVADMSDAERRRHELDEMRSEIAQSFRLGAMTMLSNAIAHEINQPLTVIRSYVETLSHMVHSGDVIDQSELVQAMDNCAREAERAGLIVRRLREFLTRGHSEMERASMETLIENAAALAMADGKHRKVRLDRKLDPDADIVLVDPVQIEQVIFNLLRNAFQAMAHVGDARIQVVSHADGAMTELIVEDSGPGLLPEIEQSLFEKHNSSKPDGMGMGLAICRLIVEAHGGKLWAGRSSLGGAAFHFTVPRAGF